MAGLFFGLAMGVVDGVSPLGVARWRKSGVASSNMGVAGMWVGVRWRGHRVVA